MLTGAGRVAIALLALAVVGCGSDDTDGDDGAWPDTPLRAVLDTTSPSGAFDAEAFGVDRGSVTAASYAAGDRWAVHYDGLTPDDALGKCPGNSIRVDGGFEHVSNSPYGALACQGYEDSAPYEGTILPPPVALPLRRLDDRLRHANPAEFPGTLYGSLEQVLDDGSIQGATSQVVADAGQAPAIDVADCTVVS
jgi:hypothetical protein